MTVSNARINFLVLLVFDSLACITTYTEEHCSTKIDFLMKRLTYKMPTSEKLGAGEKLRRHASSAAGSSYFPQSQNLLVARGHTWKISSIYLLLVSLFYTCTHDFGKFCNWAPVTTCTNGTHQKPQKEPIQSFFLFWWLRKSFTPNCSVNHW